MEPPVIEGFTPSAAIQREGFRGKFVRKVKENPLVPIGCLATAAALTFGLISFRQGKSHQSQLMMRTRIGAQGFTVVALIFGIFMTAAKSPSPPK
ncbi:unnamed protein product [Staurois parvus]|uniref:HIG1 domain-containing protein n=1 Tax=Staurois parvus TaxID=386267 RepID=A0ABN9B5I0_9NEOB|nr:unnamed protein product [Staurois parvus]